MSREDALEAILDHVRLALFERRDYLRARAAQVNDRFDAGELSVDAVEAMLGAIGHDLAWFSRLVDELDMLRVEVGLRRAAERLG